MATNDMTLLHVLIINPIFTVEEAVRMLASRQESVRPQLPESIAAVRPVSRGVHRQVVLIRAPAPSLWST
jgi:hypothetical protein